MFGQIFIIHFKSQTYLSLILKQTDISVGLLKTDTMVRFESSTFVNIVGKCKQHQSIINPQWNFDEMGIGGLDDKFSAIFRRAFASRIFPHDVVAQLGMKHCRGILLHGPPGTGKTLMARQIAKMLNCREPKIVNGPQIFNKYIGESESNIRNLFVDAEEEEKRMGPNSGLHIIIFDEIDAICKTRGSSTNNINDQDTVVNQLLSKIDGMNQLNNIIIIVGKI
jgi:vesicle-fusing ATPase